MHELHDVFEAPTNPDIAIWRYMDLPKLVSMLEAEALHFVRADAMLDKFEGSTTRPTHNLRRTQVPAMTDAHFGKLSRILQGNQLFTYLNCWHMNEHESAAMWSIYQSGQPQGIAIRSTYRRLSESILADELIYIGTVSYVDFDDEVIPDWNLFYPYVHKRRSFDYERELRALYYRERWVDDEDGQVDDGSDIPLVKECPVGPPVIPIGVDLDRLVESIYVSPEAQDWFAEVIRSVLGRYGRSWPVHHSDLDGDPVF